MLNFKNPKLIFAIIILLAAFLRLYGLNWDSGAHLHPDERFLTMVATSIKWPRSFSQYLDPIASPLNPVNAGYSFFVYGTFPLFLVKALAELVGFDDYARLNLVGRAVSALFDVLIVILVYLIAKQLNPKHQAPNYKQWFGIWDLGFGIFPLMAAFFYAFSVLPIQLSHYFAVDTFLVFFLTLSFYLLIKLFFSQITNYYLLITLAVSFGLALASKISALLFLPIIIIGLLIKSSARAAPAKAALYFFLVNFTFYFLLFTLGAYLSMRLANPYAFASGNILDPRPNSLFVQNLKTLKSFEGEETGFPPAIQWITTKPLIFPFRNMLYYGLGIPLGLLAIGGFFYVLFYLLRHLFIIIKTTINSRSANTQQTAVYQVLSFYYRLFPLFLILLWVGGLFLYQGTQFVKAMRYFAPIYPFLAILAAFFFSRLNLRLKNFKFLIVIFNFSFLLFNLLWPLSFLSIYSRPNTRIQASKWIYENIPDGSTLGCEHWDDCLPLPLNGTDAPPNRLYKTLQLPLYDPDTKEKWDNIKNILNQSDYLILSSSRLYGSIPTVPQKYPVTSQYYALLFSGKLGFLKAAEFTSRPNLPLPFIKICFQLPGDTYGYLAKTSRACDLAGISLIDDFADESYTVYDHPKVIIFQKTK